MPQNIVIQVLINSLIVMLNLIHIHLLYQSQVCNYSEKISINKSSIVFQYLSICLIFWILWSSLSLHYKAFDIVRNLLNKLIEFLDIIDLGFLEKIQVLVEKCLNCLLYHQFFLFRLQGLFLLNFLALSTLLLLLQFSFCVLLKLSLLQGLLCLNLCLDSVNYLLES